MPRISQYWCYAGCFTLFRVFHAIQDVSHSSECFTQEKTWELWFPNRPPSWSFRINRLLLYELRELVRAIIFWIIFENRMYLWVISAHLLLEHPGHVLKFSQVLIEIVLTDTATHKYQDYLLGGTEGSTRGGSKGVLGVKPPIWQFFVESHIKGHQNIAPGHVFLKLCLFIDVTLQISREN